MGRKNVGRLDRTLRFVLGGALAPIGLFAQPRDIMLLVTGVLLGAGVIPLVAQSTSDTAGRAACFRIRPAPACRSYWLVEVQGVVPVASSTQSDAIRGTVSVFDDNNLEFNLGHMLNVASELSLGGAVTLGSGSGGVPDGVRARVRWWMAPAVSLELEGGVLRTNLGSWVGSPLMGPSMGLRANLLDVGAVLLRYDRVDVPSDGRWSGGPASSLSLGASASSGHAVVVSAIIGLGLTVLMLTWPGGT